MFKPDNVLCTADGRACVGDFGLARASDGGGPRASARDSALVSSVTRSVSGRSASLTRTGAMMGTPAYMAPEQHLGAPVGPAADIFAFCVALYEALHGQHPFGGDTFIELQINVLGGVIREPPRGRGVPPRLSRVITSGLAIQPQERPPTMAALLGALERAARPTRRRWLAVEGGLVAALVAAGLWGMSEETGPMIDPASRCEAATQAIDGTWGGERASGLRRAFAASGLVYAGDVADRVVTRLGEYGGRWSQANLAVCRAYTVEGALSEAQHARASACLERLRRRLDRIVIVISEADEDLVKQAVALVDELEGPESCGGDAVLAGADEAGRDPARTAQRERNDAAIEDAKVWNRARRYDAAAASMSALVAELEGEDDLDQRARAMIEWSAALYAGDRDGAKERADEAIGLCWRAGDDRCVTDAVIQALTTLSAGADDGALIAHLVRLGDATLDRLGGDLKAEGRLRLQEGIACRNRGDLECGLTAGREALALARRVGDRLAIARASKQVGIVFERLGRYDPAIEHLREVVAILSEEYGGDHPEIANAIGLVAVLSFRFGDYPTAIDLMERQTVIERKLYGPASRQVADVLSNVAIVSLYRGDLERARSSMRESQAILDGIPSVTDVGRAQSWANMAEILRRAGDTKAAAVEVARSLATLERALPAGHPDFITANAIAGHLAFQVGDLKGAAAHYGRAQALIDANGLSESAAYLDLTLGRAELALRRGRVDEAAALLEGSRALLDRELHHAWDRATLAFVEARIFAARGDLAAARARARAALDLYSKLQPGAQRERDEADAWLARH